LEILDRSVPLGDKAWKAAMSDMKQQVERSVEEIRRLSYELRPSILDDLGLVSTLRWYTDLFSKRTGIQVVLDLSEMEKRLEMSVETALYRITQEALTNVARHAEASHVRVSLQKRYGSLVYLLEDNGKGFPMNNLGRNTEGRNSLGLLSIRERTRSLNGDVEIISRPGEGTQIKVKIPLVQG
jgi:signal transduction histidine kinase